MGIIFIVFIVSALLIVLWLPTLIALRMTNRTFKQSARILLFEILWLVGLIFTADISGVLNPGAYMILSLILVSVGGFLYVLIKRKKSDE